MSDVSLEVKPLRYFLAGLEPEPGLRESRERDARWENFARRLLRLARARDARCERALQPERRKR